MGLLKTIRSGNSDFPLHHLRIERRNEFGHESPRQNRLSSTLIWALWHFNARFQPMAELTDTTESQSNIFLETMMTTKQVNLTCSWPVCKGSRIWAEMFASNCPTQLCTPQSCTLLPQMPGFRRNQTIIFFGSNRLCESKEEC